MGKAPKRGRDIAIKTQFNIGGSRGKDVGHFISDYVARDAATDASMAWVAPNGRPPVQGDGVAFTLGATAISRQDTLDLAAHVQGLFARGDRAIEQMVISFAPEYLVKQGLVPPGIQVLERGAYRFNYDDVRLRHAVRAGVSAMLENDGYHNGDMVAAIQSDTLHLHVHAVVYEDSLSFTRRHGREERGMLRESSLKRLSHHIGRHLTSTRDLSVIPTQRLLMPQWQDDGRRDAFVPQPGPDAYQNPYLGLLEALEREEQEKEQTLRALEESLTEGAGLML